MIMIVKEINKETYNYPKAELFTMLADESIVARLFSDEDPSGTDNVSFSLPYPFELTVDEVSTLKNVQP